MKIAKAIFFISCFFVLAAMGSNAPSGSSPVSPTEIDKLEKTKAPDFSLKDVNGKSFSLSSLRGKVVLLNFWATWCPPCIGEMPAFNRLYNEMRSRGLEVVAVSADSSLGYVKDFTGKNSFGFRILHDEKRTVTRQYKVFSLPTTFLIDRNGVIVEKFFGEYDWADADIKKKIERLF